MKARKFTYSYIITIFAIYFNVLIIIFPKEIIKSAKNGLLLWYNFALPSLLPFIIGTNILKSTNFPIYLSKKLSPIFNKIFKISGNGAFPIVCGMLSGYPLGAKLTCDLYNENKISKSEAQRILCFSNNSGPIFIIGTIGTQMLNNSALGYKLLAIHIFSAITLGMLLGIVSKKDNKKCIYHKSLIKPIGELLNTSISNGIETIVAIGGYIVFFSILYTLLSKTQVISFLSKPLCILGMDQYTSKGVISGLLEITNGCSIISKNSSNILPFISMIVAWGGFSIHAQSMSFIAKTDLSAKKYILAKFVHSIIAGIYTYLFI